MLSTYFKGNQMSEMEQRRTSIEEIVRENGAIMLTDIAARLGVTTMTIRRDLETLVKRGKVSLYHGVIIPSKYSNYQLLEAQNVMIEQKMRIAKAAASMITEGDTIILDAGSTVSMLARELPKKNLFNNHLLEPKLFSQCRRQSQYKSDSHRWFVPRIVPRIRESGEHTASQTT